MDSLEIYALMLFGHAADRPVTAITSRGMMEAEEFHFNYIVYKL